jgi:hypothetical protein
MRQVSRKFPTRTMIMGSIALALLVVMVIELDGKLHLFWTSKPVTPPITANQATKGETTTTPATKKSNSPPDTKQDTATTTTLIQPVGNFVSAHKNVSMSTAVSSVCNTSSGAQCQITFTSGDLTRSLPAQTADLGGTAYWESWTPASINLTPGTWQIKATATLGGNTATNTDAVDLEVVP